MNEPDFRNGNGNGNGHAEKSPSERAWDTARQKAREQGQTVRDEEIRCIKSKGLTAWAKLLFWILSKICWEASPFLHNKRVGSVCITSRQLQLHFGFPNKRLYAQTKKSKDKDGKITSTRRVPGAIEELVNAGLVWMSHKQIHNIPSNKWPNVFNVAALVTQEIQTGLGLLEDVVVVEDHDTNGGSSDFLSQNGRGSGQTLKNGLAKHQRGELATTNGGSSQPPHAGVAQHQRGELATTNGGSSADTNGGSRLTPTGGVANPRTRELATPARGTPIKTSGLNSDSLTYDGEALPTEKQFQDWLRSLDGMFPSGLRQLEKAFSKKLSLAQSPQAKAEWKRRLTIVQERLLGGPVEDKERKPVRLDRKPEMSFEQQKKAWEKAKKALPDQLRKKAAGATAVK